MRRKSPFPIPFVLPLAVLAALTLFSAALSGALAGAQAAPAVNKHAVAVIVGNKAYAGDIPEVLYAHRDAEAMKRFVLDVLGYRAGNLIDLRDATGKQIEAVFGNRTNPEGKLYDWIRPQKSDVLVFYSGHGVPGLKDHSPYLLPVDGDANKAEITGYPLDVLYANLEKSRARSVMVYLDACFSGGSPKGMLINAASGLSVSAKVPKSDGNISIITAAQGDQFASWDEQAQHGLFTEHLLAGLYGVADGGEYGNGDGTVTAAEIKAYLDDELTYQARRRYGRRQTASVDGSPALVLARLDPANPPARPRLEPPTPVVSAPVVSAPVAQPAPVVAPAAPATTVAAATLAGRTPAQDLSGQSGVWSVTFLVTQCFIQFAEDDINLVFEGDKFKGAGQVINVSGRVTGPDTVAGDAWVHEGIAEFKGKFANGQWSGEWEGTEGCNGTFTFAKK